MPPLPDLAKIAKEMNLPDGVQLEVRALPPRRLPDDQVPMIGVQTIGVLVRQLNEAGQFRPEGAFSQTDPQTGQVVIKPVTGRHNFVTAEDLVEMMREMIREEITRILWPKEDEVNQP